MESNHFEGTIAKLTAVLDSLCDTYHQKVKDENYSGLSYVVNEICNVSKAITGLVEAEAKATNEESLKQIGQIIGHMHAMVDNAKTEA